MMSQTSKRELLAAIRPRYTLGSRTKMQVVLDELVATNGDIDWVITNCPDETVTAQVAQDANDVRWQVEELHRGPNNSRAPRSVNTVRRG
jgi:hypothetical protein